MDGVVYNRTSCIVSGKCNIVPNSSSNGNGMIMSRLIIKDSDEAYAQSVMCRVNQTLPQVLGDDSIEVRLPISTGRNSDVAIANLTVFSMQDEQYEQANLGMNGMHACIISTTAIIGNNISYLGLVS